MRAVIALLALAAVALASTRSVGSTPPAGWTQLDRPIAATKISVSVWLRQQNLEQLEERFWTLSNPQAAEYGQWMTPEDVLELVAPSRAQQERVVQWLKDGSVDLIDNRRDVIEFTASVSTVEQLLNTEFRRYRHEETGRELIRSTSSYGVPDQLDDIVEFLRAVDDFPVHRGGPKRYEVAPMDANGIIEPSVIKAQYNIPADITVKNPTKATQGPAEFDPGQVGSYGKPDLSKFAKENAYTDPTVQIVGPYFPNAPEADESNLDIQFITGVAQGTNNFFWTAKSGFMLELAEEVSKASARPAVISVSWGAPEAEISGGGLSPVDYVRRTDVELQKLGAMGITVLVATGDNGSSGGQCGQLMPDYPATSPYVTAVGATMLSTGSGSSGSSSGSSGSSGFTGSALDTEAEAPICQNPPLGTPCATPGTEVVCSGPEALITSGGGFSSVVPRPAFQKDAVDKYLNSGVSGMPSSGLFNSTGRGYPDWSAFGHAYVISNQGQWVQVDGTSCSTPVTAAFVTLLNDQRISAGKAVLGPINQMIYQAWASDKSIFNDIVTGNNDCHEGGCCSIGYPATTGWDAASGLGSPNFAKLSSYVANMS